MLRMRMAHWYRAKVSFGVSDDIVAPGRGLLDLESILLF